MNQGMGDGSGKSPREIFWPPIEDAQKARYYARHGFWATVANALLPVSYLVVVQGLGLEVAKGLDAAGLTNWAIIELIVAVPVAVGQYLYSRVAAFLAPAFFIAGKILLLSYYEGDVQIGGYLVGAVWLFFYLQGIRGTLALQDYRR